MSKVRIFRVTSKSSDTGQEYATRLIKATTANIAERFVINETVNAVPASADDVAELMDKGVKIERSGE